jgi:23S rRNA pseudouridine2605 synthase
VRLQKFLAESGVASRRASEKLIAEGRVKVDGLVVKTQGRKIDPEKNKVQVDDRNIKLVLSKTYIAFYKPRGVLSTMSDPLGRSNLGDYFSRWNERLFHVGRLDKESEGLILLTNDGAWAQRVAHPKFGLIKKYLVNTERAVTNGELDRLRVGVRIDGGVVKADSAKRTQSGLELRLHEGRNQVVRKMLKALDLEVLTLLRTEIGSIRLGEMKSGKWRYLSTVETTNI